MSGKIRHIIELSAADIKNSKIRFTSCGRKFFPENAFGGPKAEQTGKAIALLISGVNLEIKTDLPTDKVGNPRWFPRERSWIGHFYKDQGLVSGDKVKITRISERRYSIEPLREGLTFIDLFAGIGGIRKAFESAGARCVFSSEWDKFACETYFANFNESPSGDITKIPAEDIPDHDILTGGFPCQPFSIAGVSKKNSLGKKHGFADETQGTLFFDICRIIDAKKPKAFMLENVKH